MLKLQMVLDYDDTELSQAEFLAERKIKRSTLNMWQRKRKKLASTSHLQSETLQRANKLTLGGRGRVSKTDAIEDALVHYIKDLRRDEVVVCRDTISHAVTRLMPDFFKDKSRDAALTWCSRFMRRRRLTVLRATRSGRKLKEEVEEENMYLLN
ncbi:TPA: LOW QUALITY PROTEIN: hypothetical protein N0F65_005312 [Lagenidium giganteum]|uniref:HTH CENPB-type domain-containing protein n=1 Tax=Lagenidium giganteum TaxID=4803 RepID=A0AAV2YWS9_9STRA|nr:TPA: LOW QUALITY PROTEIN: hypothetical protein N0F65_005312 [Lagenidium giganteum]